jgi:glycosyltransferase involved in cell wall biosynthesis
VYRALATANAFARAGWRVTVLTASRDTFTRFTGTDESLEERVDPAIEVVRVPFAWPLMETDVRQYSRARVLFPALWRKWQVRQDQVPFPEIGYGPWKPVIERAALDIHRRDPVDLVLATANPHVTFAAAAALHRQAGVPYVMDYRDAWLLDVFSGDRLHEPGSRAAELERSFVRTAHEVWFVNRPILAWHQQVHPAHADRFHVVENGFDRGLAPELTVRDRDPARSLDFGYIGTMTPAVPLAAFVSGWRLAKTEYPDLTGAHALLYGYLGYYATPRPDLLAQVQAGSDVGVSYCGPVGKAKVADVYANLDALLLVLGTGAYVTSGKVYEYLATGLPIVSVHHPGNAVSEVLDGYPLWFPAPDLTPDGIAAALGRAGLAARHLSRDQHHEALVYGQRFSRDAQLEPRITALTAFVERRREDAHG